MGLFLACDGTGKPEKFHDKGMLFFKHGKYHKAIEQFELALAMEPDRTETLLKSATAYNRISPPKPNVAIQYAERVLEKDPNSLEAQLIIGQGMLHQAEQLRADYPDMEETATEVEAFIEKSRTIADRIVEQQPESLDGLNLKARLALFDGKFAEAETFYRRTLEAEEENNTARLGLASALMAQKDYVALETALAPWLGDSEDANASLNRLYIESLAAQGRYDEAWELLAPKITKDTEDPDINNFMLAGRVLLTEIDALNGRQGGAEPAEQEQIQERMASVRDRLVALGGEMKGMYPQLAASWYFRGVSYELLGENEEATEHFRKAHDLDPRVRIYTLAWARALIVGGDPQYARSLLRNILKEKSNDYEARMLMAESFFQEGDIDEAVDLYREMLISFPGDTRVEQLLNRTLLKSPDHEDVREGMDRIGSNALGPVQSKMLEAEALMREADQWARMGSAREADPKFRAAEDLLREARLEDPGNDSIAARLADLAMRRGDLFSALGYTREAVSTNSNYRTLEASLLTRLGQQEAAHRIYTELLEAKPQSQPIRKALVDLEIAMGRSEQAEARLKALLEEHPSDLDALARYARLLNDTGRELQAIELLLAKPDVEAAQTPTAELQLLAARMLMSNGQPRQVIEKLKPLCEPLGNQLSEWKAMLNPPEQLELFRGELYSLKMEIALAHLMMDEYAEVEEQIGQIMGIAADQERSRAQLIRGVALTNRGQFDEAIKALGAATIQQTEDVKGIRPLLEAVCRMALGERDEAFKALENINLNRNSALLARRMLHENDQTVLTEAAGDLGKLILLAARPNYATLARQQAERTAQLLQNEPFVISRHAEASQLKNDYEVALTDYARIYEMMPEFTPAALTQAEILAAQARRAKNRGDAPAMKEYGERAIQVCDQVLERTPSNHAALYQKALMLELLQRTAEANAHYRQVIEIDPNSSAAYNNLAWNLLQSGDLGEAARLGYQALKLAPESPGIEDTVGWIEYQRGNYAEALELISRASRRLPNEPDVRFHLAQAYMKTGRNEDAADELEALVLSIPGYEKAGQVKQLLRQLRPQSRLL